MVRALRGKVALNVSLLLLERVYAPIFPLSKDEGGGGNLLFSAVKTKAPLPAVANVVASENASAVRKSDVWLCVYTTRRGETERDSPCFSECVRACVRVWVSV